MLSGRQAEKDLARIASALNLVPTDARTLNT
jgi:hypothetical protein